MDNFHSMTQSPTKHIWGEIRCWDFCRTAVTVFPSSEVGLHHAESWNQMPLSDVPMKWTLPHKHYQKENNIKLG